MADVEQTLRAEFMSNLARTNRRDNHELMAEIFNSFDRSTEAGSSPRWRSATRRRRTGSGR